MPSEQPSPSTEISAPAGIANNADRVPWNQLIAYGMGGLIPIALFNIAGQLIGLLGNIQLGIDPIVMGCILFLPRLWDAFSDPFIGHLSDNVQTRWGRRRPFILLGGIMVALSFVGMWWVPRGEWIHNIFSGEAAYDWFQFIFILTGLLIFYTSCNLFEIPHGALGMAMSKDYHERTRLFSSKSFFGNMFAMGTPWLLWLSSLDIFREASGDLVDGMRYVSLLIAAVLIPMSYWWFRALREPGYEESKKKAKSNFWADMATTGGNRHFIYLVVTMFTLATGFQFVGNFNNYITIFYIYGGNLIAATKLLAIVGTAWAVTGLLAVFPLNWISRRIGKRWTMLLAIGIMCSAQLSKIICYNPELPYLMFIPTVLLSTGMLMFFTLGSSMVGDVCDEDELDTGSRREGSYYSVAWWFIKLGTAFAILISGVLLKFSRFDEQQHIKVESFYRKLESLDKAADKWKEEDSEEESAPSSNFFTRVTSLFWEEDETTSLADRGKQFDKDFKDIMDKSGEALIYFEQGNEAASHTDHGEGLLEHTNEFQNQAAVVAAKKEELINSPIKLKTEIGRLSQIASQLMMQDPKTIFRLMLLEIGLPLLLSIVSVYFAWKYPLTEERCKEIKEELQARRAAEAAVAQTT